MVKIDKDLRNLWDPQKPRGITAETESNAAKHDLLRNKRCKEWFEGNKRFPFSLWDLHPINLVILRYYLAVIAVQRLWSSFAAHKK